MLLEAGRHAGRSKPAVAACFGAHAQEEWAFAAVHLCVGVVFLLLAAPLAANAQALAKLLYVFPLCPDTGLACIARPCIYLHSIRSTWF